MAIDEALAVSAVRAFRATLRFYGWSPPAVSLGHHQSAGVLDVDEVRSRGLDVVRRPTGGMAVLHDEEITLALAGPDLREWGLGLAETVIHLAGAVSATLSDLGYRAQAEPGRQPSSRHDGAAGTACFSGGGRHEVWIEGRKIAGLAARRWGRAFLVHGSFLLGRSHLELAGLMQLPVRERSSLRATLEARTISLAELDPARASRPDDLTDAIAGQLARSLPCELVSAPLDPAEERAVGEILARSPNHIGA